MPQAVSRDVCSPFKLLPIPDCAFCGARRLQYEPPNFCCCKGTVVLVSNTMPSPLRELFAGEHELSETFKSCVRTYNNTFAFTSIGIHRYDKDLCQRDHGIYTFKVQGQIHHFIGDLLPGSSPPKNLQLYFFDTEAQVSTRVSQVSRLHPDVVSTLVDAMSYNPYAQFFSRLREVSELEALHDFSIIINSNPDLDQRVFNAPTASQVAAIWIENSDDPIEGSRNIRVFAKDGHSHFVQYYYGCYDPLQYPLFFPNGDVGWHQGIDKCRGAGTSRASRHRQSACVDAASVSSAEELLVREEENFVQGLQRVTVSCREYYAYKFQVRDNDLSMLLSSGRLLQQFVVDTYIKIETQLLDYFRVKQNHYRTESLQGLVDSLDAGAVHGSDVGRRVILPSSFIGGPRDMRRRYMDAMALVQTFGKPDIFLTITCNPNWPEIKELLRFSDQAQDRPDLLARVFNARLQELKNDIFKKHFFGHVSAYVYTIEFQKRGLPHAYFLVILEPGSKMDTPSACDNFICAEIPDEHESPLLYSLVKKHMFHGPCGPLNPACPCMVKANDNVAVECKSKYPRPFAEITVFPEDSTYPIYRRRDSGKTVAVRKENLDNRWVVPNNPTLLLKYDCHINVEFCATIESVKYLYKYIYKGHDRVSVALDGSVPSVEIDEIHNYQNARWVSPPEAAWRIFGFRISEMKPSVIALQVHLPNYAYVNFYGNSRVSSVVSLNDSSSTMLTQFFNSNNCILGVKALGLTYVEFPQQFVWNKGQKKWTPRKKNAIVVGRLVHVCATEGERYYLRLLLKNIAAPTSYENLRTVHGQCLQTFRQAAEKLGLCSNQTVVEECLNEAVLFEMPSSLRKLFATLLIFCDVSNPCALWESYKAYMCEDFARDGFYTQVEMERRVLNLLDDVLESMGKSIAEFNLVDYSMTKSASIRQARELEAEYNLKPVEEDLLAIDNLNSRQRVAFDSIMSVVTSQTEAAFFYIWAWWFRQDFSVQMFASEGPLK